MSSIISFSQKLACIAFPALYYFLVPDSIVQAAFLGSAMVLLYPEKLFFLPLPVASLALGYFIPSMPEIPLFLNSLSLLVLGIVRIKTKYSKVITLFSNESLRTGIVLDSFLQFSMILMTLQSAYVASQNVPVANIVFSLLSISLYVLCCIRMVYGRSFIMSYSKESEILSLVKGNLRNVDVPEGLDDRKMSSLYKKALKMMKNEEIYVRDDFDLEYLARQLYTNKVYLSKTINICSGRNFSQFVNYFRIEKVVELLKADSTMRVESVGLQVGFRSISAFNIAFKMFKGITPREWLERYREGGL